jgi:hypothetical protein
MRTARERFGQATAALLALAVFGSVLSPVGVVAAAPSITITQSAAGATATPGDTITVEATVDYSGVNAPAIDATLPSGWTVTSHTDDGGTYGPPQPAWIWVEGDGDGVSGSHTVTYTVQVPGDASPGDYTIAGEGSAKNPADSSDVVTTDDLTITVEDTNTTPTADAGPDQTVDEGTTVTLDATGSSDSDGSIASYAWTQTGGPSVSLSDASAAQPTFTAPEVDGDETMTFEVEVTDDDGATATDTVGVTAQDTDTANTPPTIDAISDQTVIGGESVNVSVSASDDDGDSVSLSLSQSPGFVTLANGEITIAPQSGDAGTYTVEVTADDGTTTTTESFGVTVEAPDTGGDGDVVFAVNAGGGEYTANDGTTYAADTNFDGGSTYAPDSLSGAEISNTDDDTLYKSERYGSFSYDVPVDDGEYEVTLQFAEIYHGVNTDSADVDDRVFDVNVEGGDVELDEYDIVEQTNAPLTATSETVTVDVTDGELNIEFSTVEDNAKVSAIKVEKVGDAAPAETSADVAINPGAGVEASTYGGGSYQVTNTGDTNIQTLTLDLSETMLPDMVFDPFNTAGDDVGKEFTLDGGDVTVQNVEYTNFHNGVDNDAGYDTMVVTLSGFEPGETMSFSVDNDPTSIDTTDLGSQAAGPVSGLEITGGTISVDSGSGPVEATIVGDGSAGGAMATVQEDTSESTPSLSVDGASLSSTPLSDRHAAATTADAQQTITISGAPANAEVMLLRVEGELNLNNVPTGYDIEEYEANKANQVQYYPVTTDSNGEATVEVTLTDTGAVEESGLNYFTAWVVEPDGDTGPISDYVVLELDPDAANTPPTIDPIADETVTEDDSATVSVSASDADGDDVSLSLSQAPAFVSLSNGEVTIAPQSGDAGTYTVEVTAEDGTDTATESFQVTVEAADTVPGPIGSFENAPADPDGDGTFEDVNGDGSVNLLDAQAIFANQQDPVVQSNVEAFDFNDDGSVNVLDAQALFANGVEV